MLCQHGVHYSTRMEYSAGRGSPLYRCWCGRTKWPQLQTALLFSHCVHENDPDLVDNRSFIADMIHFRVNYVGYNWLFSNTKHEFVCGTDFHARCMAYWLAVNYVSDIDAGYSTGARSVCSLNLLLYLRQSDQRHNVSYVPVRPSFRSWLVRWQTCEHISKTNEPICYKSVQVVHGPRAWNDQLRSSGGQRSRSHDAEVRFGGLAEASLSTPPAID